MKNLKTKRIVSLLTAVLFAATQLAVPLPALALEGERIQEVRVSSGFQMDIPPDLGTIQTLNSGQGPTLIHIQTAHGNYEAQKKIQAILHYLKETYGVKLLLVEGSPFKLKPELIRFFPNEMNLTNEIADGLAQKALLKGAELFLIDDPEVEAYGIENLESYRANTEAFRHVLTEQEKTHGFIEDMDMQISRLTGPYLNKDLRAFLKRLEDYESKHLSLTDWLAYLKGEAKKELGIDLTDPAYQIDWPTLLRVFKLSEIESKMNAKAFASEREPFLKAIHSIPREIHQEIEKFLSSPLSRHQLPDPETSLLFENMVVALPADFNYNAYPNVKYLITHLILQSEIKGERLMEEIDRLSDSIADKQAKTEEEKKILALLKDHRLLKRLFALELTPEDYDVIASSQGAKQSYLKPSEITQRFLELNGGKRVRDVEFTHTEEINALFEKALEFYRGVKERDGQMIENIVARMKETGADKAAVITGGFHTEPFKNFFEAQGYNYALIAPKITTFEGREAYIRSVLQNHSAPLSASTLESIFMALYLNEIDAADYDAVWSVPDVIDQMNEVHVRHQLVENLKQLEERLNQTEYAKQFGGIHFERVDEAAGEHAIKVTFGKYPAEVTIPLQKVVEVMKRVRFRVDSDSAFIPAPRAEVRSGEYSYDLDDFDMGDDWRDSHPEAVSTLRARAKAAGIPDEDIQKILDGSKTQHDFRSQVERLIDDYRPRAEVREVYEADIRGKGEPIRVVVVAHVSRRHQPLETRKISNRDLLKNRVQVASRELGIGQPIHIQLEYHFGVEELRQRLAEGGVDFIWVSPTLSTNPDIQSALTLMPRPPRLLGKTKVDDISINMLKETLVDKAFVKIANLPKPENLAPVITDPKLGEARLVMETVEGRRLRGSGDIQAIFDDTDQTYVIGTSQTAVMAATPLVGLVDKKTKEFGDGSAVHAVQANMLAQTQADPKLVIINQANEGKRDASYNIRDARIYWSSYEGGFKDFSDVEGKTFNREEFEKELAKLRAIEGIKIRWQKVDAVERTAGTTKEEGPPLPEGVPTVGELVKYATDSNSFASLSLDDPSIILFDDNTRVFGIAYHGKEMPDLGVFDDSKTIYEKRARTLGIDPDPNSDAMKKFMKHQRLFSLGPRPAGTEKEGYGADVENNRHGYIIKSGEVLKQTFEGFESIQSGDGNFLPGAVALLGLDLDGKKMTVPNRYGRTEGETLADIGANVEEAQFLHRDVSNKNTSKAFKPADADRYEQDEIEIYKKFGIPEDYYRRVKGKADLNKAKGRSVVAITSLTGASERVFGPTFARLFHRPWIIREADGKSARIIMNTLVVSRDGSAYMIRTTWRTANLDTTLDFIKQASPAARQFFAPARAEVRGDQLQKKATISLVTSDNLEVIIKALNIDLSLHGSPMVAYGRTAITVKQYEKSGYVGAGKIGLLYSDDMREPLSETKIMGSELNSQFRKIMSQLDKGTRFQLLREEVSEKGLKIPFYAILKLDPNDSPWAPKRVDVEAKTAENVDLSHSISLADLRNEIKSLLREPGVTLPKDSKRRKEAADVIAKRLLEGMKDTFNVDQLNNTFTGAGIVLAKGKADEFTKKLNKKFSRAEVRMPINPFLTDIQEQVREAGRILGKSAQEIADLIEPEHVYAHWLETSQPLTSGRKERFLAVRVQHRRPLGEDGRPERSQGGIRIILPAMLGKGPDDTTSDFYKAVHELESYLTGNDQTDLNVLIRFLKKWIVDEAKALATGMSFKNKVAGLPLGGGKGAILLAGWENVDGKWRLVPINNGKFEIKDVAVIMRDVARAFAKDEITLETVDGGAPDVNPFKNFVGTGEMMGWLVDETLEYLMERPFDQLWRDEPKLLEILRATPDSLVGTPYLDATMAYALRTGHPIPVISRYTGKKVGQGGSLYRDKSTGEGAVMAAEALVRKLYPERATSSRPLEGFRVAIQGFGNAGIFAAYRAIKQGALIIAVSDSGGAIIKRGGGFFTEEEIGKLVRLKEGTTEKKSVVDAVKTRDGDYRVRRARILGKEDTGNAKLLELPVDLLIPAALENQINESNVDRIKAPIVSEAANGASTKGAMQKLYARPEDKRSYVLPFILASLGGVAISSKEIEQNFTNHYLSEEELRQWLEKQMQSAVDAVWRMHEERKVDLGTAAFLVGMQRLTRKTSSLRAEVRVHQNDLNQLIADLRDGDSVDQVNVLITIEDLDHNDQRRILPQLIALSRDLKIKGGVREKVDGIIFKIESKAKDARRSEARSKPMQATIVRKEGEIVQLIDRNSNDQRVSIEIQDVDFDTKKVRILITDLRDGEKFPLEAEEGLRNILPDKFGISYVKVVRIFEDDKKRFLLFILGRNPALRLAKDLPLRRAEGFDRLSPKQGSSEPRRRAEVRTAEEEFIERYAKIQAAAGHSMEAYRQAIQELVALSEQVPLTDRIDIGNDYVLIDLPAPAQAVNGVRPTQVLYDTETGQLFTYTPSGADAEFRTTLKVVFRDDVIPFTKNSEYHQKLRDGRLVLLVPRAEVRSGTKQPPAPDDLVTQARDLINQLQRKLGELFVAEGRPQEDKVTTDLIEAIRTLNDGIRNQSLTPQEIKSAGEALSRAESLRQTRDSALSGAEGGVERAEVRAEEETQAKIQQLISKLLLPEEKSDRSQAAAALLKLGENPENLELFSQILPARLKEHTPDSTPHKLLSALTRMVEEQQRNYHFSPKGNELVFREHSKSMHRINDALRLGILRQVTVFGKTLIEEGKLTIEDKRELVSENDVNHAVQIVYKEIFKNVRRDENNHPIPPLYTAIWGPGYASFTVTPVRAEGGVERAEVRAETSHGIGNWKFITKKLFDDRVVQAAVVFIYLTDTPLLPAASIVNQGGDRILFGNLPQKERFGRDELFEILVDSNGSVRIVRSSQSEADVPTIVPGGRAEVRSAQITAAIEDIQGVIGSFSGVRHQDAVRLLRDAVSEIEGGQFDAARKTIDRAIEVLINRFRLLNDSPAIQTLDTARNLLPNPRETTEGPVAGPRSEARLREFFTPLDRVPLKLDLRAKHFPSTFSDLGRDSFERLLVEYLGIPASHAAIADTALEAPAGIFQEMMGEKGPVVIEPTQGYLASVREKFAAIDSEGSVIIDGVWRSEIRGKDLLNLFEIGGVIQSQMRIKRPVFIFVGDDKKVRSELRYALTNQNNGLMGEDLVKAVDFSNRLNELVLVIEPRMGETPVQVMNRYIQENPGVGSLVSTILDGLKGDVNFVGGKKLTKDVAAMPFVIERILYAAAQANGMKKLDPQKPMELLQAELIREIGIVVSIVQQSGQSYLVIQTIQQFIESLLSQRHVQKYA